MIVDWGLGVIGVGDDFLGLTLRGFLTQTVGSE
jgi:hypothetical protein